MEGEKGKAKNRSGLWIPAVFPHCLAASDYRTVGCAARSRAGSRIRSPSRVVKMLNAKKTPKKTLGRKSEAAMVRKPPVRIREVLIIARPVVLVALRMASSTDKPRRRFSRNLDR